MLSNDLLPITADTENAPPTKKPWPRKPASSIGSDPDDAAKRLLLIEGVKDFDANFPPETAANLVDRVLARAAPQNEAEQRDDEDFLWRADNEDIVMPEQRATAVYRNCWGQVVIRQERTWDEDTDAFIIIARDHVPAVINRLQALLRQPGGAEHD
jgi:hypothetical protein